MEEELTMEDLDQVAHDARDVLAQVHQMMARPNPSKQSPTFTAPYIADLCKIERTQIRYLAEKHGLPYGKKIPGSKAHEYSLAETIQWAKTVGNFPTRPAGKLGKAIATCNYKGGV